MFDSSAVVVLSQALRAEQRQYVVGEMVRSCAVVVGGRRGIQRDFPLGAAQVIGQAVEAEQR
jgi:hypothetical protein